MPGTLGGMADRAPGYRDHLTFALDLHHRLTSGGDACFSPYSVACALGMAHQAARGSTAGELRALLSASEPDIAKHVELLRDAATLHAEDSGEEPALVVCNALWIWDGLDFNADFRTGLAAWPGAKLETAPFVTDPEGARRTINSDVARLTRDLIRELIPAGAVDESTVASLVNSIYLKAAWRNPFAERDTGDAEFHAPAGTHRVPMMHQVERLPYARAGQWQSVTLPASGGVEAVVLLPDARLDTTEPSLDSDLLDELLTRPAKRRVALSMPRLTVRLNASLVEPLQRLGVRELFTKSADLTGLSDDPRLSVSDVLHESVLELDEHGLEGAAATAVMMRLTSVETSKPVEFRVDRPFLLLIRHADTGAVYFLARVTDPS